MGLYDTILQSHREQDYGDLNTASIIDDIITAYPLFPNEALYVIDCKNVQVEPLSKNFRNVIGIDSHHRNDLNILYDHIDPLNLPAAIKWVEISVNTGFNQDLSIEVRRDIFQCMYLNVKRRVILKSTAGYIRDSKGAVRYCIGKLSDMTDLVHFRHFTYGFYGPNQSLVYDKYHREMGSNLHLLTKREREVLNHIGSKYTSRQIANILCISKQTVDKHRRNIIRKMETSSAMEAYHQAKNMGLRLLH